MRTNNTIFFIAMIACSITCSLTSKVQLASKGAGWRVASKLSDTDDITCAADEEKLRTHSNRSVNEEHGCFKKCPKGKETDATNQFNLETKYDCVFCYYRCAEGNRLPGYEKLPGFAEKSKVQLAKNEKTQEFAETKADKLNAEEIKEEEAINSRQIPDKKAILSKQCTLLRLKNWNALFECQWGHYSGAKHWFKYDLRNLLNVDQDGHAAVLEKADKAEDFTAIDKSCMNANILKEEIITFQCKNPLGFTSNTIDLNQWLNISDKNQKHIMFAMEGK